MRDISAAVSALPAFATSVHSTFPGSRLSSLCVSHGSDLGEWSVVERQQKATDLFVCLRRGQVSSLSISLWVYISLLYLPVSCEEKQTTSAEFGSCLICLSSHQYTPLIHSILVCADTGCIVGLCEM